MEKDKNEKGTVKKESEKDKQLDKVFWFKVGMSVVCGILFGLLNMKGFYTILLFSSLLKKST